MRESVRGDLCVDLLSSMRREGVELDAISYSAAISACEKASEWTYALDLLSSMRREGFELDTISYVAAISAGERESEWTYAS